jgi:transcriptional regulator Rrf2-like protein
VISPKAKYALRALVELAREGDSLVIGEIAARKNIPRKFLEQILLEMKRHGIVHSRRGKLGGYRLLMCRRTKLLMDRCCGPHRWANCPIALLKPYRLSALRRLQDEGNLRKFNGFLPGLPSRPGTCRPSPIPSLHLCWPHVQVDERAAARRVRLDQVQVQAAPRSRNPRRRSRPCEKFSARKRSR